MPDVPSLLESVDRLADRFRAMPQSRLLAAVPGHPSRAAAALALADQLARAAQLLEEGAGAPARQVPDVGVFAVGDQIAVAGHDLAAALAAELADGPNAGVTNAGVTNGGVTNGGTRSAGTRSAGTPNGARPSADVLLAEAVAAVDAVEKLCS
ncbi:hypothetical protein GCM10009665_48710 [Kitasatospora nipponensis]|uniref:Uncharacterized protein n=1 Tax=Kitasatospora nipponensis TaxID=258049 RepID=A0ABP4H6T1_9ACTN